MLIFSLQRSSGLVYVFYYDCLFNKTQPGSWLLLREVFPEPSGRPVLIRGTADITASCPHSESASSSRVAAVSLAPLHPCPTHSSCSGSVVSVIESDVH